MAGVARHVGDHAHAQDAQRKQKDSQPPEPQPTTRVLLVRRECQTAGCAALPWGRVSPAAHPTLAGQQSAYTSKVPLISLTHVLPPSLVRNRRLLPPAQPLRAPVNATAERVPAAPAVRRCFDPGGAAVPRRHDGAVHANGPAMPDIGGRHGQQRPRGIGHLMHAPGLAAVNGGEDTPRPPDSGSTWPGAATPPAAHPCWASVNRTAQSLAARLGRGTGLLLPCLAAVARVHHHDRIGGGDHGWAVSASPPPSRCWHRRTTLSSGRGPSSLALVGPGGALVGSEGDGAQVADPPRLAGFREQIALNAARCWYAGSDTCVQLAPPSLVATR